MSAAVLRGIGVVRSARPLWLFAAIAAGGCYDFKPYPGADATAAYDAAPDGAVGPDRPDASTDAQSDVAMDLPDAGSAFDSSDSPDSPVSIDSPDPADARDASVPSDASDASAGDVAPEASADVPTACESTACGAACVDLQTDARHCGACGHDCTALSHVVGGGVACVAGACSVPPAACAPGWAHCSALADDGCETDLSRPESCGACATRCVDARPLCQSTASGYACASGCGGAVRCGGSCVDTQTSAMHCGGCGAACPAVAHGAATCVGGRCTPVCAAGYHACAGECLDDTSVASCGTRCSPCPDRANATTACVTGACTFGCNARYANCDGSATNGCEASLVSVETCGDCATRCAEPTPVCSSSGGAATCGSGCGGATPTRCGGACVDTATDLAHCGGCARPCVTGAHSLPSCTAGACGLVCDPGFADCDHERATGCEVDVRTSLANCGACDRRCTPPADAQPSCAAGACGFTCNAGYHRCGEACASDSAVASCGTACAPCPAAPANGTATCAGGACGFACNAGYHRCGGACASDASVASCGGACAPCPVRANAAATCVAGACGFTCAAGYVDCNRDPTDGCEADLASDRANCGACANACPGTSTCRAGECTATCAAPQSACGLQCFNLNTDVANCGACGHACRAGYTCVAGLCGNDAVQVTAGDHTCALRGDGRVFCWGYNSFGQVGDGTMTHRTSPAMVSGLTAAVEVSTYALHACARLSSGSVSCWGLNDYGQLGDNTTTNRSTPVSVSGLSDAVQIAAGLQYTCARRQGGSVVCWGLNDYGQLGDGTRIGRRTPVTVTGLTDAVQISASQKHVCALRATGQVVCWGESNDGRLGDGMPGGGYRTTPVTVAGLVDATAVDAGGSHTCALRVGGTVVCWGYNNYSQLGDGTMVDRSTPVAVLGLTGMAAVSAGAFHSCALDGAGRVWCWGGNPGGELGDGTFGTSRPTPAAAVGLLDALQMSAGAETTCARRRTGGIDCWGFNGDGQLGRGLMGGTYPSPAAVIGFP
jgi:alpha-tubulin suppressor-like RCC1 family protein